MAQQQNDPQRKNEPRDQSQAHQPNREGGGRSRDQGNRDQQPPDRGRQQNREQGQGRSGEANRQNDQRNEGGERR